MSRFRRYAGVSWLDYLLIRAARRRDGDYLYVDEQMRLGFVCLSGHHIILLTLLFLFGHAYIITSEGVCFQSVMRAICHHIITHTHIHGGM